MSAGGTTRVKIIDGKAYRLTPGGMWKPLVSRSDPVRVAALTDEEIEAAVASDPDAAPIADEAWFAKARLARRRKDIVTLRLDHDVVEWFREQGEGYQTRMNEVLRTFVEHHRKQPKAAE